MASAVRRGSCITALVLALASACRTAESVGGSAPSPGSPTSTAPGVAPGTPASSSAAEAPLTIEERVLKLLLTLTRATLDDLVPGARLREDLRADDLTLVRLGMALEDEFGFEVPDADLPKLRTVADVQAWVRAHQPR